MNILSSSSAVFCDSPPPPPVRFFLWTIPVVQHCYNVGNFFSINIFKKDFLTRLRSCANFETLRPAQLQVLRDLNMALRSSTNERCTKPDSKYTSLTLTAMLVLRQHASGGRDTLVP